MPFPDDRTEKFSVQTLNPLSRLHPFNTLKTSKWHHADGCTVQWKS